MGKSEINAAHAFTLIILAEQPIYIVKK